MVVTLGRFKSHLKLFLGWLENQSGIPWNYQRSEPLHSPAENSDMDKCDEDNPILWKI